MMFPLLDPLPSCPVCGGDPQPVHVARNRDTFLAVPYYAMLVCRTCGLLYVGPRPSPEAIARFYAAGGHGDDEWHAGRETADATDAWRRSKQRGAGEKVAAIRRLFPDAQGSALDFGCGVGALMDALSADGWHTVGLEPHPIGEVAAARHTMITALPPTPSFNLVVAHHVLEHLCDPVNVLRQLHAATHPGGIAFLSVPCVEALSEHGDLHYVCNPIHMNGFTAVALTNALHRSGWKVVATMRRGRKKLEAFARRVDGPLPMVLGAEQTIEVLRAFARQVNAAGRFEPLSVT